MESKIIVTSREELKEIINELVSSLPQCPIQQAKSKYFLTNEAAALFFEDDLVEWIEKSRRIIPDEDPTEYLYKKK
jgi:uncharacterized protein (DUF1499 family)